jgi:acyl-CoA synthetase (AMP-forming)/AMP-acid ligase II
MREYWKQPEATAETIKDGWLHTGDMGRIDEEGFFYVVDRKKDMIVSGGLNVYPAEVEDVIHSHPKVLNAAVIGLPHDIWGEAVAAVVVPRSGKTLEEQELIKFCRENLADYKSPKAIIIVDKLPLSTAGKVLRRELREQYNSYFSPKG